MRFELSGRGQKALALALAVVGLVTALSSCASPSTSTPSEAAPPPAQNTSTVKNWEDFDATSFDRSAHIDNAYLPLKPGTRYVYEGTTVEDDGTVVPHRIVINVTDLTKVIGGVRSVVTWDLDYSDGELVEAEVAFFAQDKDGNVWRMGEYPEEYDEGKLVGSSPWLHGYEDARAGIEMKSRPQPGTPSYSQGWGPKVGWTDRAVVHQIGQKTCVKVDCYDDVVVTAESSASEPGAKQFKYYARNVGNVKVGWEGAGDQAKETLELVQLVSLDAKGLAEIRAGALKLEKSAYVNSKNVYAHTPPAEPGGAK
jgi:hypothetical protein